jgi:hypothetical protein
LLRYERAIPRNCRNVVTVDYPQSLCDRLIEKFKIELEDPIGNIPCVLKLPEPEKTEFGAILGKLFNSVRGRAAKMDSMDTQRIEETGYTAVVLE